jgi:hypothetical protein
MTARVFAGGLVNTFTQHRQCRDFGSINAHGLDTAQRHELVPPLNIFRLRPFTWVERIIAGNRRNFLSVGAVVFTAGSGSLSGPW